MNQRCIPNAEVVGYHECLLRSALLHAPSPNRECLGHGQLGHQKGSRKAIRYELPGIVPRPAPLPDKLVDLHSVAPDVVAEFVGACESPTARRAE